MSARPSLNMLPDELLRSVSTFAGPRASANLGATSRTAKSIFKPHAFNEEQIIHKLRPEIERALLESLEIMIDSIQRKLRVAFSLQDLDKLHEIVETLRGLQIRFMAQSRGTPQFKELEMLDYESTLDDLFAFDYPTANAFVEAKMRIIREIIQTMINIRVSAMFSRAGVSKQTMEERFNMGRRRSARRSTKRTKSVKKRKTSTRRRKSPKRR